MGLSELMEEHQKMRHRGQVNGFLLLTRGPLHMNYSFSVQNVQRKQAHDSPPCLLDEGNISYTRQTNPCPLTPSTVPLCVQEEGRMCLL